MGSEYFAKEIMNKLPTFVYCVVEKWQLKKGGRSIIIKRETSGITKTKTLVSGYTEKSIG